MRDAVRVGIIPFFRLSHTATRIHKNKLDEKLLWAFGCIAKPGCGVQLES